LRRINETKPSRTTVWSSAIRTPMRDFFGAAWWDRRVSRAERRTAASLPLLRTGFFFVLTRERFRPLGSRRFFSASTRDCSPRRIRPVADKAQSRRLSYLCRVRWLPLACRPFVPRARAYPPSPDHHAD